MKEFLLITLVCLILFRVFRKIIFVSLVKTVFNKAEENFRKQQEMHYNAPRKTGEMHISTPQEPKNSRSGEIGEYVEYEEVK
jgi:hypothetical protein